MSHTKYNVLEITTDEMRTRHISVTIVLFIKSSIFRNLFMPYVEKNLGPQGRHKLCNVSFCFYAIT